MKKFTKKLLATLMAATMAVSSTSVVFAAEVEAPQEVRLEADENVAVSESSTRVALEYASGIGTFRESTGVMSCIRPITNGTYKIYYNVDEPCTLILWSDNYSSYSWCTLSGSGTKTVPLSKGLTFTGWQLWGSSSNSVSYSVAVTR